MGWDYLVSLPPIKRRSLIKELMNFDGPLPCFSHSFLSLWILHCLHSPFGQRLLCYSHSSLSLLLLNCLSPTIECHIGPSFPHKSSTVFTLLLSDVCHAPHIFPFSFCSLTVIPPLLSVCPFFPSRWDCISFSIDRLLLTFPLAPKLSPLTYWTPTVLLLTFVPGYI